jgi:hypothetical protein
MREKNSHQLEAGYRWRHELANLSLFPSRRRQMEKPMIRTALRTRVRVAEAEKQAKKRQLRSGIDG